MRVRFNQSQEPRMRKFDAIRPPTFGEWVTHGNDLSVSSNALGRGEDMYSMGGGWDVKVTDHIKHERVSLVVTVYSTESFTEGDVPVEVEDIINAYRILLLDWGCESAVQYLGEYQSS